MTTNRSFNGTCEVFDVRNCTGSTLNTFFIDPCSCMHYYQCTNNFEMLHRSCSEGTAFNYITGNCDNYNNVIYNQDCDEHEDVWNRCKNITEGRRNQLAFICTNITKATTSTPKPTSSAPSSAGGGNNQGIIIGVVIAGVVLLAVLGISIVLFRRRHKAKILAKRTTLANNPEYFEGGNLEDPYAVINDSHVSNSGMHEPTYTGTMNTNGTLHSNINTGFVDTEYDNSSGQAESGYTATLRRSLRDYEIPKTNASKVSSDSSMSKLGTDENGNKSKMQDSRSEGGAGISSNLSSSSSDGKTTLSSSVGDSAEQPDYYVLEKDPDVNSE